MGILDDLSNTISRGTAAAERSAKTVKLKARLNEVNKKRQQLASQLGASLYEETKDVPEFRSGRESLYGGIAACDEERSSIQDQISAIESQAAAEAAQAAVCTCQVCGSSMGATDLFCSGCGTPAEQALAAADQPSLPATVEEQAGAACAACGASMGEGDAFCMSCGAPVSNEKEM